MIKIDNLTKSYRKQWVLKSVSLMLHPGQCIALVGPNGSGKTTLIKTILGLVLPSDGVITVNGRNITDGCNYRGDIGYMPQISRYPEHMQVSQLFSMMKKMRPGFSEARCDEELYRKFKIDEMGKKALGSLSGGMRQQVSAALAFLFDPLIIILDEPTAALDPVSNEILKNKINQSVRDRKLVLVTSHILSDLDEIASQVIYLMDGEVLFFETIEKLRQQTSETQLNKIIVRLMNREFAYEKG